MSQQRAIIFCSVILALGALQVACLSIIINNDHTDMPFLINLDVPYQNNIPRKDLAGSLASKQQLLALFLNKFAAHFHGLQMNDLMFQSELIDKQLDQWSLHHYKQRFRGVEVFGGELKVRFDHQGSIRTMSGVLLNPSELSLINTTPNINEETASSSAQRMLSVLHPQTKLWSVTPKGLTIFKYGLTGPSMHTTTHLAYKIAVESSDPVLLGYEVLVNAHNGEVLMHMSTINNILHRRIEGKDWYNAGKTVIEWDEVTDRTSNITQEMQNILTASKAVYNIFYNLIGYDSFDNKGTKMMALYGPFFLQCPNAFYSGGYTNFCPGMAGIDVVAHEWGHGYVSTYGGGLVYKGQSGALNEAFADIIGESTQLMLEVPRYNPPRPHRGCAFNASKTLRWILGEQTTKALPMLNSAGLLIGMRDMYNPTCYKNPATTSDPLVVCNPDVDNGGVHSNSGVPNQAYALFVDGGVLNKITVKGVGMVKAFNIYIRALGSHTSTTNFIQHAELLKQACKEFALNGTALKDPLTGTLTNQIVDSADCNQLELALNATGLNEPVKCHDMLSTPTILVPPAIGKVMSTNDTKINIEMIGMNFNVSKATLTVTELNYGLNFKAQKYRWSGSRYIIEASYEQSEPLEPADYSLEFEYLNYSFGPYSYQTYYPTNTVKITPEVVQSNTSSWIVLELADPVREFKGCVRNTFSNTYGDCMHCIFNNVDYTPAFLVDETHVRCETPWYIPTNITVNVSLSLNLWDYQENSPMPLKFLDLNTLDIIL